MGPCLMQGCNLRNVPDGAARDIRVDLIPCFCATGGRRSDWGGLAGSGAAEELKLHCRHRQGWLSFLAPSCLGGDELSQIAQKLILGGQVYFKARAKVQAQGHACSAALGW